MATTEELVVHARLRDDLSRGLHAVEQRVERTARRVRSLGAAATTALGSRSKGFLGLGAGTKTLRDRLGGLSSSIRSVGADLRRHIVDGGRTAAMVITGIGLAAAGMGIKVAADLQLAEISLRRLTGSAEGGKDIFKFLTELDPMRPFDLAQLNQSAVTLGNVISDTEELKRVIAGVTDVASLNPAALDRVSVAVAQMLDAGVIRAQDLLQLQSAGIPGLSRAMQKAYGMSMAEVAKANEGGATMAVAPFLDALMEGAAGTGEEIATQTFRGMLSSFKSNAMLKLNEAFKPLLPILQGALGPLADDFGVFIGQIAGPLSGIVADLVPLIGRVLGVAGPVLGAIFTGLGRLLDAAAPAFDLLAPVVDELVLAIGTLVTELVPVMPDLVEGFVLLVGLLPDFVRFLAMLVPLVSPLVDILDTLLGFGPTRAILLGIAMAVLAFGPIASIVTGVWQFVGAILGLAGAYQRLAVAQAGAGGPMGTPVGGAPGTGVMGRVGRGLGVAGVGLMAVQAGDAMGRDKPSFWSDALSMGGKVATGAGAGFAVGNVPGAIIGGIGGAAKGFWDIASRGGSNDDARMAEVAAHNQAELARFQASQGIAMAPGSVVIDARGMTPEQLARLIPAEIEAYNRDRAERGPRGARS